MLERVDVCMVVFYRAFDLSLSPTLFRYACHPDLDLPCYINDEHIILSLTMSYDVKGMSI